MKKISNDILKEEYYTVELDNGLHVYLYPKPQFHRTYGIFSTKFGSCDMEFYDQDQLIHTPAGVAHFLEHKMFECSDGNDASDLFSIIGGETNAYTTYDKTAYLVTCTDNNNQNIETLLDFVQSPYFTKDNVDKEKGIIEQEIRMYLDNPSTSVYIKLLDNMYHHNHVKYDIGGTIDSIKDITEDTLYQCYNKFYHPSNMVLAIIGNFDLDETYELIKNNQQNKQYVKQELPVRHYYIEDAKTRIKESTSYMDITTPKVGCGLKLSVQGIDNKTNYKNGILLDMICDIFFDESSDFYHRLMKKGIINNSFVYETYYELTYAHIIFNVDTDKVEEFQKEIKDELLKIKTFNLDETTFNRHKKVLIANAIARFNYLESIVNFMIDLDSLGLELFETINIKKNIQLDDFKKIQEQFNEESITFHTIYPKKSS